MHWPQCVGTCGNKACCDIVETRDVSIDCRDTCVRPFCGTYPPPHDAVKCKSRGHIMGGHLEMLEQRGLAPTIRELGGVIRASGVPEDHILECDADTFAAHIQSFIDLRP